MSLPQSTPEPVAYVANLMSTFPGTWALCGGWAVDAWLGRVTREHGDVDVLIFADDQLAVREHLEGWQLVGHDDNWSGENPVWPKVPIVQTELWEGHVLEIPGHIHARSQAQFDFEINLIERNGDTVTLNRSPVVSLPVGQMIAPCGWGIPTVTPSVVAYFKLLMPPFRNEPRPAMRPKDESDLLALLPLLHIEQRAWLGKAVARGSPRHPWLARLGGSVGG